MSLINYKQNTDKIEFVKSSIVKKVEILNTDDQLTINEDKQSFKLRRRRH